MLGEVYVDEKLGIKEDVGGKKGDNEMPDPKRDSDNLAEYKDAMEYLQWKFKRQYIRRFSEIAELEPLITAFDNAVEELNFPEATNLMEKILGIVKETFKKSKDFDLDQILPAFMKR